MSAIRQRHLSVESTYLASIYPSRYRHLFLAVALTLSAASGRAAPGVHVLIPQGCDVAMLAASAGTPDGYAPRGNYCDGVIPEPNSGELAVVSITLGDIAFTAASHLRVSAPEDHQPAHLRGSDLRPNGAYRLDGVLSQVGLDIDLMPSAIPNGLSPQTIGLRAWRVDATGRTIYLPVQAGIATASSITVILRSDQGAIRTAWQICYELVGCQPQHGSNTPVLNGGLLRISVPRLPKTQIANIKVIVLQAADEVSTKVFQLLVPQK